jgi:hypothetical protein
MATVVDKHSVIPPSEQPGWKALEARYQQIRTIQHILPGVKSEADPTLDHDSSTNTLTRLYRKSKETP